MQSPSPSFLLQKTQAAERLEDRHRLARLGLAWLANMQVMMFAFPGYFRDEAAGTDNFDLLEKAVFAMNWISLTLTVPVVLYCAWPVWQGGWRRTQHGGISMDVPVALSIIAAFIPSAYATWSGTGEVYFESVTMFVAFLLSARYLEHKARQQMTHLHPCLTQSHTTVTQFAQRLAFWFVLVQLGLALVVGACWLVWMPTQALSVTVALLVMSCPCAMAIAVPTAWSVAYACLRRDPQVAEQAMPQLTHCTQRIAYQNLLGAVVWHILMTPLAAVGLVQPWLAAIAMLLSSVAVAANSWRIYQRYTTQHCRRVRLHVAAQEL